MKLSEIHKNLGLHLEPFDCAKEITCHNYLSGVYDKVFENMEDAPISLLEIGVHRGGSLVLWKEYFKKGVIHGMDKQDVRCEETKNLERVNFLLQDAYFDSTISALQNYDIIIDDGSHFIGHQEDVIRKYYNKLNVNGILIVEDINGFDDSCRLEKAALEMPYKKVEKYDHRKFTNRYDTICIVCYK